MNSIAASMVIIPGVVALLLFLVFTYLYEQSRQQYFRAWQLGWGAYTLHYALDAWTAFNGTSVTVFMVTSLLLVAMAFCIFVSTRLMRARFRFRWYDLAIALAGIALAAWNLWHNLGRNVFHQARGSVTYMPLEVGLGVLLLYCSFYF